MANSAKTTNARTSASEDAAATGRSERKRVQIKFTGETLTEQNHKSACDINNIMARYVKTGTLDHVRKYEAVYADVLPSEYHDAMTVIADTKTMFEELPSELRSEFKNDPEVFLRFCATEEDAGSKLEWMAEAQRRKSLGLDPLADDGARSGETQTDRSGSAGREPAPREAATRTDSEAADVPAEG